MSGAVIDNRAAHAQHAPVWSDSASSSRPAPAAAPGGERQWFCLKAKPKHEHIAAAHVQLCPEAGVFLPRIRFERPFKGTRIWVTEPLFPGYLFARFNLDTQLPLIRYAAGVQTVVHFGLHIPIVADAAMAELLAEFGPSAIREVNPELAPGDAVKVVAGAFAGWTAVVTRVLPARQRVAVLMEFLGRQMTVEIPTGEVLKNLPPRHLVAARRSAT